MNNLTFQMYNVIEPVNRYKHNKTLLLASAKQELLYNNIHHDDTDRLKELGTKFLRTVENGVTGAIYRGHNPEFNEENRKLGNDWPGACGHTMVGFVRLNNIKTVIEDTLARSVPGDFMELGVWRGGSCIYAAAVYLTLGVQRNIYVFDAFEPISGYGESSDYLAVSLDQIKQNFDNYGLLESNIIFRKGLFESTLKEFASEYPQTKLAILRMDSNFYDPHMHSFYYVLPFVQTGGYLIFDDIVSHPAVAAAWRDFQAWHGLAYELIQLDHHSAYVQITAPVVPDFSRWS